MHYSTGKWGKNPRCRPKWRMTPSTATSHIFRMMLIWSSSRFLMMPEEEVADGLAPPPVAASSSPVSSSRFSLRGSHVRMVMGIFLFGRGVPTETADVPPLIWS